MSMVKFMEAPKLVLKLQFSSISTHGRKISFEKMSTNYGTVKDLFHDYDRICTQHILLSLLKTLLTYQSLAK